MLKVYLAHPSSSREEGKKLERLLVDSGFCVLNPFDHSENIEKKLSEGIPFEDTDCLEIVNSDLYKLFLSDVTVAIFDNSSIGTPMEVALSVFWQIKPVFVLWKYEHNNCFWCPSVKVSNEKLSTSVHPWLRVFTNVFFSEKDLISALSDYERLVSKKQEESNGKFPRLINFLDVVGLAGLSGSGKSSFAQYLQTCGYHYLHFVLPVYDLTQEVLKEEDLRSLKNVQSSVGNSKDLASIFSGAYTMRTWTQKLGTGVRRAFGREVFCKHLFNRIWHIMSQEGTRKFVIDSVRLPDEVRFIKLLGGRMVWIQRSGENVPRYSHPTETSITKEDCDIVIEAGSLGELCAKAIEFVKANKKR